MAESNQYIFLHTKIIILPVFLLMGFAIPGEAQSIKRYNVFNYNVNEGLLQSTVGDLVFDNDNFCWISFPNGIQKFDGHTFTGIPVQPGLPDDKSTHLFQCKNGDVLISHTEGVSLYETEKNAFRLIYKNPSGVHQISYFAGEDDDVIFTSQQGNIIGFSAANYMQVSKVKFPFNIPAQNSDAFILFSDNIINHKMAIGFQSVIYLWDLEKGQLLYQTKTIPQLSNSFLHLESEVSVMYVSQKRPNRLLIHNFSSKADSSISINAQGDSLTYLSGFFSWQGHNMISFGNHIYEMDSSKRKLENELVNFQNKPIGGSATIGSVTKDHFENLWVTTGTGGIRKILNNHYLIKYYGNPKTDSNFILSVLPDKKNNRVLLGTNKTGLLIFDTLQRLVKAVRTFPGIRAPGINAIINAGSKGYFFFIVGSKYLGWLSHDLASVKKIPIKTNLSEDKSGTTYFGNFLFQNQEVAVVQSQGHIYKLDLSRKTVTEWQFTSAYTLSGMFYGNHIITHTNDELLFLDTSRFQIIKAIPFKNTAGVRCFAKDNQGNIYLGSNKGVFKINSNGAILEQFNKEGGLPDDCIYAMVFDREQSLWCSTNKGVIKINADRRFFQVTREDGLQENEFNTNVAAIAEDGELFFGGVNGVSSFYPENIQTRNQRLKLLITDIQVNNTKLSNSSIQEDRIQLNLNYRQNSLAFDFIAMGNNNPNQYVYQYKMKGVDDNWKQNNDMQTVRYFLSPGTYTFQIYASRFYNKDAKPLKEIHIVIHPPFWKTWWFISILFITSISLLAYIINRYNRAKYLKELRVMESEKNIRMERERLSRDLHDNIGGYANAVLYKTELLKNESNDSLRENIITDLRFVSKDIITSLRETVWALKKEDYSAQECLIRIRNFINAFSSYYPGITFKIEGDAPEEKTLHHSLALDVVRIIQESVTNAIKHSNASVIIIDNHLENDKWIITVHDNGRGFDVEFYKKLQKGNGLSNMEKRAEESGISFRITSGEKTGTSVCLVV